MSTHCANCGTPLQEDALFCPSCGSKQTDLCKASQSDALESQNTPANPPVSAKHPHTPTWTATMQNPKVIFIGAAILCVAVVIWLLLANGIFHKEAPFFGIQRGDSVEKVEQQLGTPDDFDDNGMRNYDYYYDHIEFLDMEGYVKFHFELDKVDSYIFVYHPGTADGYNDAVKHYTKKYGSPDATISDYAQSYNESECSVWKMDDGTTMRVRYHSGTTYLQPTLEVEVIY